MAKPIDDWRKPKICRGDYPGPGEYPIPSLMGCVKHDFTKERMPCYKFGIKLKKSRLFDTPGPIYDVSPVTKYGKITTPQAPLSFRNPPPSSKFALPGPNAYSPEMHMKVVQHSPPEWSFGYRRAVKLVTQSPGPKYLPNFEYVKRKKPEFKAGIKLKTITGSQMTPAPNAYGIPSLRLIKRRAPEYSLVGRRKRKPGAPTPAPNAYWPNVKYIKESAGATKFNSKTNPCIQPYITKEDIIFNDLFD